MHDNEDDDLVLGKTADGRTVSIDEVMENAGLTHGSFYRHFRDKDELYAEAVRRFLCTDAPKPWQPKRSKGWHASRAASASLMPTFPETISTTAKRAVP
jgi:AcrR family transcriptional regulator